MRKWLITNDPVSRDMLVARLGETDIDRDVRVLPEAMPITELSRLVATDMDARDVIVADLTRNLVGFARLLQETDILQRSFYFRSRIVSHGDGLAALAYPFGKGAFDARSLLSFCDQILARGVFVDLEDITYEPTSVAAALVRWLGSGAGALTLAMDRATLGQAFASLRASCRGDVENIGDLLSFDEDIAFRPGGSATLILRQGWYGIEPNLVWSRGAFSRLRIPTGASDAICRLDGAVIDPAIEVEVKIDGETDRAHLLGDRDQKHRRIAVLLAPAQRGYVEVDLAFTRTVRPSDVIEGSLDTRALALHLATLRLVGRSPQHVGCRTLELSEVVANDDRARLMAITHLRPDERPAWLSEAMNWCRGTARILGAICFEEEARRPAGARTQCHTSVGALVDRILSLRRPTDLVVGPERLLEVLRATAEFDELRDWVTVHFAIGLEAVTRPLLDWMHRHELLLVSQAGCIVAVRPEP